MTTERITGALNALMLFMNPGIIIDLNISQQTVGHRIVMHAEFWPHENSFSFYVFEDDDEKSIRDALECSIYAMNSWIEKL